MKATIHAIKEDFISQARQDLAACFRWTARLDMHESIANHFSFVISGDGKQFLCNPRGRHFSNIKASELIILDSDDETTMQRPDAPDPTAWAIHGAMHRQLPQAKCLMHVHSRYATALACLADSTILPIDQNTMRFYNRYVVDHGYDGMGLGCEAERLATLLGDKKILIMGNHGLMFAGENIAECFDTMYYFERAARTLIDVYATGREPLVANHEVAEKTAQQWESYGFDFARQHLDEIKVILDREEPDYRL